jgi:hypothetical protein
LRGLDVPRSSKSELKLTATRHLFQECLKPKRD